MARRKGGAAPNSDASVQETEGAMGEQTQKANIRLKEGAEPITLGDLGYKGIKLPATKEEQAAGWYEPKASIVAALYGTHYELLDAQG